MLIRNKAQCSVDHKWTFSYAPNVTCDEIRHGEFCFTQLGNYVFQLYSLTINRLKPPKNFVKFEHVIRWLISTSLFSFISKRNNLGSNVYVITYTTFYSRPFPAVYLVVRNLVPRGYIAVIVYYRWLHCIAFPLYVGFHLHTYAATRLRGTQSSATRLWKPTKLALPCILHEIETFPN
jgi:hypothetical protein